MSVVIETTLGDLTVDLYTDIRPSTSDNFLKLCQLKYYNGCPFHLVQRDFVAQTGDPHGNGGESALSFLTGERRLIEAERKPKLKHDRSGLLSMVNNGENLHGSQFFLTLSDSLDYLDGVHTVFGEVVEGHDVLVRLNDAICDDRHRPYQDILITHTVVLDDPFPMPEGLPVPAVSPPPPMERLLQSDRIGLGEDLLDPDRPAEQVEEELKDKEASQRALVLEMIGDLPDADVRPPENVLFICKLNPVTREEDLQVIFSRFGTIISCEIIKDDQTGDSLQYGFIEFDRKEDCEQAYFKMDNVLIDDRRIHVDFSQSVSRIKWRGKGRGVAYLDEQGRETKGRDQDGRAKDYLRQYQRKRRSASPAPRSEDRGSEKRRPRRDPPHHRHHHHDRQRHHRHHHHHRHHRD